MTGYAFAIAPCFNCRLPFTFNPHRVPSIRVHGEREPVCLACVEAANPVRKRNGLPPIVVLPGAYECTEEGEL